VTMNVETEIEKELKRSWEKSWKGVENGIWVEEYERRNSISSIG
jgi:hypothetical protein